MKFQKTPIALAALALCAPFAAQAAPSVSITSPQDGTSIGQASSYVCTASASGASRVEFALISSSGQVKALNRDSSAPYNCSFNSYHYLDGNWTLRAVAYDSRGASATATRRITINNKGTTTTPTTTPPTTTPTTPPTTTPTTPPTSGGYSFVAPASGGTIVGDATTGAVAGLPKCGVSGSNIAKVVFYVDNVQTNYDMNGSNGWGCYFNTKNYAAGSTHTLKAVVTNTAGQSTTISQPVVIGQASGGGSTPPAGNTPPNVTFLKPANNATVAPGKVACEVTATDSDGIAKLEWMLNDRVVFTETSSPFNFCEVNTTGLSGAQVIKARATDKKGAVTTAQVTVNVASSGGGSGGGDDGGGATPGRRVDSADIISRAWADLAFAQQPNIYTDVLGSTPWMSTIPETGRHGSQLANGETMRFGKETDPLNSSRKAMTFQLAPTDPTTGGSHRVELGFPRQLEMNKVYWLAVSVYVHDWGTLATNDQSLFGFQVHSGTKLDLSPTIALYAGRGGRTFKISARHSTSSSPSQSNSVSTSTPEHPIQFGQWMDFVVKFKQNTSGGGFAQVWMNGTQIMDYHGNLGFNTPGFLDYVKWGYYNWSGSTFTGSGKSRKVRLRGNTIVSDQSGKYTAADIRTLLGADDGSSSAGTSGSTVVASSSPATSGTGSSTAGATGGSGGGVCSNIFECAAQ